MARPRSRVRPLETSGNRRPREMTVAPQGDTEPGLQAFSGAFLIRRALTSRRLGGYYMAGSALCLLASVAGTWWHSATWLVLLWPAIGLAIVAFGYFGAGAKIFQKGADAEGKCGESGPCYQAFFFQPLRFTPSADNKLVKLVG